MRPNPQETDSYWSHYYQLGRKDYTNWCYRHSLSDHQLIFCNREIKRVKTNKHKQISFRLLENHTKKNFERELKNFVFPNYKKFSDFNSAYSDLVNKITQVMNNLALYKTVRVKTESNEWFDGLRNKYLIGTNYLKSSKKANVASRIYI